jgi:phosphatidylglycerol:prolipoprotein diacylglycerol transferase
MYDILMVLGVFVMLFYVIYRLEKVEHYTREQTNRLLVIIIASSLLALLSSFLIDGIFHSIQEGELTFGTISFLGGLIGGVSSVWILTHYFYKHENKDMRLIMNTLITGVVIAHAIGRIGCFCAGCCFGVPTDSFLGVIFPHGHAHDTYPDIAVFPTQLFESAFLFIFFVVLTQVEKLRGKEVQAYLIGYGLWRIAIEFIRGDNRGAVFALFSTQYNDFPTPSQFMSLFMIAIGIYIVIRDRNNTQITKST